MNSQELEIAIGEGQSTFTDITFDDKLVLSYISVNHNFIKFFRCKFYDLEISGLYNNTLSLSFSRCYFKKVDVSACTLKEFRLSFIQSINEINIYNLTADELTINSESKPLVADIYIDQSSVNNYVNFSKLNLSGGTFTLSLRNGRSPNSSTTNGIFQNATLSNVNITGSFNKESNFTNLKILSGIFDQCIFEDISFRDSEFENDVLFRQCNFKVNAMFEDIKNDNNTQLVFRNSIFSSPISFNGCRLHRLIFDTCVFEDSAFFQNTYFDILKLDKTIFEKTAFFDDIQIKQIDKCDRRSIRNIKLHLQKAENKIDYNKFRVFEFEAYKEDLRNGIKKYKEDKDHFYHRIREIKHLKRDLFILKLTGLFSDYGTDWKRAFKLTLLSGVIFYLAFFISENYNHELNLRNWETFLIGFVRFFILTDFYSPLGEGKTYIENDGWNHFLSWLFFVLGKIVIAFGIYEMIQAFRKFKA